MKPIKILQDKLQIIQKNVQSIRQMKSDFVLNHL
jgi:hypothetical protein